MYTACVFLQHPKPYPKYPTAPYAPQVTVVTLVMLLGGFFWAIVVGSVCSILANLFADANVRGGAGTRLGPEETL